jgi:hypothetical protein
MEKETIDGSEVYALVGRPAVEHPERAGAHVLNVGDHPDNNKG